MVTCLTHGDSVGGRGGESGELDAEGGRGGEWSKMRRIREGLKIVSYL